MYVLTHVYPDGTMVITNLNSPETRVYNDEKVISLIKNQHSIVGVSAINNRVVSKEPYEYVQLCTSGEVDEYIREEKLGDKIYKRVYINGVYYLIYKKEDEVKRNLYQSKKCYVYTRCGDRTTYIGKNGSYTQYIIGAREFSEAEANSLADRLTKRSKTGKYWKVTNAYG